MRCLLLTTIPPHPTNRGGNQRTALLYRALAEICELDLACLYPAGRISIDEQSVMRERYSLKWLGAPGEPVDRRPWRWLSTLGMNRLAARLAHNLVPLRQSYAPHPELQAWIAREIEARNYDVIVCRFSRSLALAGLPGSVPCLLDIDDLDTQKYASRLGQSVHSTLATAFLKRHLNELTAIMPPLLDQADGLWVTNVEDIAAVADLTNTPCEVLPNIPYPQMDASEEKADDQLDRNFESGNAVDDQSGPVVLAVCSMRMGANERGINRFIATLWPRIKAAVPDAEFHVAGSAMTSAQIDRWSAVDGVIPLGTVDDLEATYRDAAFSITPVSEGGGSKIKVAESLAFGRTCVITRHALRGYEHLLKDDESLLVADDDDLFVAHCVRLLHEPATRARLAANGRREVRNNLSERAFREIVQERLRSVVSPVA